MIFGVETLKLAFILGKAFSREQDCDAAQFRDMATDHQQHDHDRHRKKHPRNPPDSAPERKAHDDPERRQPKRPAHQPGVDHVAVQELDDASDQEEQACRRGIAGLDEADQGHHARRDDRADVGNVVQDEGQDPQGQRELDSEKR